MTQPLLPGSEIRELLRDSSRWRLLGALFQKPGPVWHDEIHVLAREVGDEELAHVAQGICTGCEAAYMELFGSCGRVGSHESEYRSNGDPDRLQFRLRELYGAFRYFPRSEEAPDHISVEAGFVAFLRLKEAFAASTGDAGRLALTSEALLRFSTNHLGGFAEALSDELEEAAPHYLTPAAEVLRTRARSLAEPVPI